MHGRVRGVGGCAHAGCMAVDVTRLTWLKRARITDMSFRVVVRLHPTGVFGPRAHKRARKN
eukprot:5733081-Prymnesium_polylepis.1